MAYNESQLKNKYTGTLATTPSGNNYLISVSSESDVINFKPSPFFDKKSFEPITGFLNEYKIKQQLELLKVNEAGNGSSIKELEDTLDKIRTRGFNPTKVDRASSSYSLYAFSNIINSINNSNFVSVEKLAIDAKTGMPTFDRGEKPKKHLRGFRYAGVTNEMFNSPTFRNYAGIQGIDNVGDFNKNFAFGLITNEGIVGERQNVFNQNIYDVFNNDPVFVQKKKEYIELLKKKNSVGLRGKEFSDERQLIKDIEGKIKDIQLNDKGIAVLRREDGSFGLSEVKFKIGYEYNEQIDDLVPAYRIDSFKTMDTVFNMINETPIIPGQAGIVGKTSGFTDTVGSSEVYNIFNNAVRELSLKESLYQAGKNAPESYVNFINTKIEQVRGSNRIFEDSHQFNLGESADANWSNIMQVKLSKYDVTQTGPKYESEQYLLSSRMFKNLFLSDDETKFKLMEQVKRQSLLDTKSWTQDKIDRIFDNSVFSVSINSEDKITGFTMLNRELGKTKSLGEGVINFAFKDGNYKEFEEEFKDLNTKALTVKLKSREELIKKFAYAEINGRYSKGMFTEAERLTGSRISNSIDYYNAMATSLGLMQRKTEYEQLNALALLFNRTVDSIVPGARNEDFLTKVMTDNFDKLKNMDRLINTTVKDINYGFIRKEEIELYSGAKLNKDEHPSAYLERILNGNYNLDSRLKSKIASQLEIVNETSMRAFYATGENIMLAGNVGKQGANAAGKVNMLESFNHPLAFIDTASQRKQQGVDDFGGLKINGININQIAGNAFSVVNGMEHHDTYIINDTKIGIREGLEKIYRDNILSRGLSDADYKEHLKTGKDFDTLEKALIKKMNGLHANDQFTSPVKVLHANTLGSWQDSDFLGTLAKMKMMFSPDQEREIKIDINSINYQRIKNLNGDFYENKIDFINDWNLKNRDVYNGKTVEELMFDETSSRGNIVKQLLGEDYEKIKIHRTNPSFITDELQRVSEDFKLDAQTGSSLEDTALAIRKYNDEYTKILSDNLINFKHGKGSIGNADIIGTMGAVNKANMGYVSGIEATKDNLMLRVAKVVTGGSGGKAMIDSVKLTENGMNSDMILYNFNGEDIIIDGMVHAKEGKLKRGFNGFIMNSIMNTMVTNAVNTPLVNEKAGASRFEIQAERLRVLQREIFDAPIQMAASEDRKFKNITLSQLFGLKYNYDESTGRISVRSTFYDEAAKEYNEQLKRGGKFLNISLENFVSQKFYNHAKSLGLDMSPRQMEIFSPYLLEKMYDMHENYMDNFLDPTQAKNARIFLKGAGAIKTSVLKNGKMEFRTFERTGNELNFLLYHFLNGMDDSISQKESSALLSSTAFLNIARQQGMNTLEEVLMEKSSLGRSVNEYKQAATRFGAEGRGFGLHNLIDYRGYTVDGTELEKYRTYADAKILKDEFVRGEFFLSNILDFDEKGIKNPVKIFASDLKYDKFGRAVNLGSSIGENNKNLNRFLATKLRDKVLNPKTHNLAYETDIDFSEEQLIKLNTHFKEFLQTGDKETFLKNYSSDLIRFHGDNVLEKVRLDTSKEGREAYSIYKSGRRKSIEGIAQDIRDNGFDYINFSESERKEFEEVLGVRVNFLSKLAGSDNQFELGLLADNQLTRRIYSNESNLIFDVLENGFKKEDLRTRDSFFFDLSSLSVSDDGRFVYNSNFADINKYAKTKREYDALNRALDMFKSEEFKERLNARPGIYDADWFRSFDGIFKTDKEIEDATIGFTEVMRNGKVYVLSDVDDKFKEFLAKKMINMKDDITTLQVSKLRGEDGEIYINQKVAKYLNSFKTKKKDGTLELPNAFTFINRINKELKFLKNTKSSNVEDNEMFEALSSIRDIVQTDYIDGVFKKNAMNAIRTGKSDSTFMNAFLGFFGSKYFTNHEDAIMSRKNRLAKELDKFKQTGKRSIIDYVASLEKTEDTKYINSLNVSPSEGTALNRMFTAWIDDSINYEEGQTKRIGSLFFNELGEFRQGDDLNKELKNFRRLGRRIYGGYIDFNELEDKINTVQKMIQDGASKEEVKAFLGKYTSGITEDLDNIVGLTLMDMKNFNKLTANAAYYDPKAGYVYGQLVRNPTIYQTSILHTKIVGISEKDIEAGSFLSGMFGTGSFDDVDRITTYNIGKLTQLVMNGDYDGDKIYAALVGMKDSTSDEKLLKVYKETMMDNAIMNEITHKRNVFDAFKGYSYRNKVNRDGSHVFWDALDSVVGDIDELKGMSQSQIENMPQEELIKLLQKKLATRIFNYENGLEMMMFKLQDELEDAEKTLHIPNFKVKTGSGETKIAKNSLIFGLYNAIQANEKGNITEIEDEVLRQHFKEAKNFEDFYSHLTKDDKDILDALIENPKQAKDIYKTIFEDKNKNKTLRLLLSSFGELTNFRSYVDNIKTGTASYELANVGRLAKFVVGDVEYEDFKHELTSVGNGIYNFDELSKTDFQLAIRNLTGADLFGILPEKAISSKHDTDTAEALITAHKNLAYAFGEMFNLKRNTKIFKDASDMYTDFKAVTTREDLIKINLFDYLNKFGDYTDDGASTADKKNILKQLMILTGVWDDSSQASLDKLTSHNQFNLFNIFALWNGGTSEGVIDANGVVNNNLKHTILRGFGHLNEIILDNFTGTYKDILIKAGSKKDSGIKISTVKALFRDITEENINDKYATVMGLDKTKVFFHGVINGWRHWFSNIAEEMKKVNDAKIPEEKVAEKVEEVVKENATEPLFPFDKMDYQDSSDLVEKVKKDTTDKAKAQPEDVEVEKNAPAEKNITEDKKNPLKSSLSENDLKRDSQGLSKNLNQQAFEEKDYIIIEGSSLQKKISFNRDEDFKTEVKIINDKYKQLKATEEKKIKNNKEMTKQEKKEAIIKKNAELDKKRSQEIEGIGDRLTDKYKKEIEEERLEELHNTQKEIEDIKTKGLNPQEVLAEKKYGEQLKLFEEKTYTREDLNRTQQEFLINNKKKKLKKQVEEEVEKIISDAENNVVSKTKEDIYEENINKAREEVIQEMNAKEKLNNIDGQERAKETFSKQENINDIGKTEEQVTRKQKMENSVSMDEQEIRKNTQQDFYSPQKEKNKMKSDRIIKETEEQTEEVKAYADNNEVLKNQEKQTEKYTKSTSNMDDINSVTEEQTTKTSKISNPINRDAGGEIRHGSQQDFIFEGKKQSKKAKTEKIFENSSTEEEINNTAENIADNIEENKKTFEKAKEAVDETVNTASEAGVNSKTAENIKDAAEETVEKGKTVVDDTMKTATKAAEEAGETIKEAFKNKKAKTGLSIGIGAALIGGFVSLLNRNRTVVHLEMNDQINQQPQQGGGYGTIAPTDNLQRKMGNYKIYTNVRDTF